MTDKKNSKLFIWIILFLLLVAPILWVMINKTGRHYSKRLPVLTDLKQDTMYAVTEKMKLVNQFGDSVSLQSLDSFIYVANFFFATCQGSCPPMNRYMSEHIVKEFVKDPEIKFVSYTVDPKHDSVPVLKQYFDEYYGKTYAKDDQQKWWFLTGSKSLIYDLAQNSYKMPGAEQAHQGFFHSDKVVLVDKQKRVRGIFDTNGQNEKKALIDAINALKLEYHAPQNLTD
jgi:protein SCO1/2